MAASPFGQAPPVGKASAPIGLQLDWELSVHARRLFYVALTGLALAVVTKRPELVGVAAPALVLLCAGRAPRPRKAEVRLRLSTRRIYEGEHVAIEVEVRGHGDHVVDLVLHPSDGCQAVRGAARAEPGTTVLSFCASRWGRRWPGAVEVVFWDRYRMFECHRFVVLPEVACYPRPAQYRQAVVLGRLANRAGDHQARSPGDGTEFIGVRQYVAGDRQRSINWAATTRRGRLQVNTFAAERSQDVVLIVDATSDIGEVGSAPVDHALRGALGVGRTYLSARDRVGLVLYGGQHPGLARRWQEQQLLWLPPGLGDRQFFRLMEATLDVYPGRWWGGGLTRIPRPHSPPGHPWSPLAPCSSPVSSRPSATCGSAAFRSSSSTFSMSYPP